MKGYIIAILIDVALMCLVAYYYGCVNQESGWWPVPLGILSGIGFWLADEIWSKMKARRKEQ